MQLNSLTLALAAGLAVNVQGAAILAPRNETEPVLMYSRAVEAGTLQYWGSTSDSPASFDWDAAWENQASWPPVASPAGSEANAQCGSNNVFCSDTNGAPTDLCKRLVNTLLNNRGVIVPSNVNGISLTSIRSICWIGWRDTIINMPQGNLIDAAAATIGKCGSDDAVSGWAENVNLNNVCSRQCLSDRLGCW
ncbi:unnamed protein product [Colletotrichum noveboracense]|uniref:WD-like domain-containing protein n=1 Tax=Colletotrichum noveboracense TaxID=2664923 RepID=A0A9W4RI08_9PEZI|nr:hypothetical protein K456DRAFT_40591 [Colletotrichum gloeosporioides 23]KAJ0282403.1 hypothetical protein COL940_005152 [Colletotrichum noveboracense]KAJ0303974.1 hypothetical protein Brms1b_011432 [Colletotrichum noveboracense]CAI0641257.1 unnamed protein product [Colletotrichum noveboracense]